jgi:hypothetical protein
MGPVLWPSLRRPTTIIQNPIALSLTIMQSNSLPNEHVERFNCLAERLMHKYISNCQPCTHTLMSMQRLRSHPLFSLFP